MNTHDQESSAASAGRPLTAGPSVHRRVVLALAAMLAVMPAAMIVSSCVSTPDPKVPEPAASDDREKMARILQLEDQRMLRVAAPPVAASATPPEKGRRAPVAAAPPAAPDLAVLVKDGDPRIRRRAALAIGRVQSPAGVALLSETVTDADPDVRAMAAFGLGLIGERSAEAVLTPLLADPVPLVRGRAAQGLSLVGATAAVPAIGQMVAEYAKAPAVAAMQPDDESWPAAPEAEAFKLGLFALVRLRAVEAIAAAVAPGGRPVSEWWPIAYALQRTGDATAGPALRELLASKGRYTRAFAARGLGTLKDSSVAATLTGWLQPSAKPSLEVAVAAVRALGQIGAATAAELLSTLAADPKTHPNLRLEAVRALGALKAPAGLAVVQDMLTDDWVAMRAEAMLAAVAIDQDSFATVISGMEPDGHWRVRAATADALGTLPPEVALVRTRSMLNDEDKRVIPSVLAALAKLKAPELETLLVERIADSDLAVRAAAARQFGTLRPAGGAEQLRKAYAAWGSDLDYSARADALTALAGYGAADAVETLTTALGDRDWAVRVIAATLLVKLDPQSTALSSIAPAPGTPLAPYDDPPLAEPPNSPHVFIELERGTIEFELAVLDAPQTTRNFLRLARQGFFNGLEVHRVVANFVVQDGDPRGDGTGGPGYTIRDELNERPFLRGTVGMALAGRDTGGSQFFIAHSPQPHLDAGYTVFGHVVQGLEVLDAIKPGDVIQRVRVWDGSW